MSFHIVVLMKIPRGRRGDSLPRRGRLRVEDRRRLHPGHALSQGNPAHQNLTIQLEGDIWLRGVLVGDQTCHQVHFQHGIFNNFCSTIGQFNKNLFNNRQFHQQHYSTIGLFNNFKFNIRQLNNSVMVNSTTKKFQLFKACWRN